MEFDNAGGEASWTAVKDTAQDGQALFKLAGGMLATGLALSAEELADILWLAERLPVPVAGGDQPAPVPIGDESGGQADADKKRAADQADAADDAQTLLKGDGAAKGGQAAGIFTPQMTGTISASTLRVPGVAATDHPEDMRRALQPFARRVPSRWHRVLDEDETASYAAETGVWSPVYRPVRERWFELSVVVESSSSMDLWDEALDEFLRLLRNQGGFRSVVAYRLDDPEGRTVSTADGRRRHPVSHLLCGQRPHLMLLASDATSAHWRNGAAHAFLRHVGHGASVSVLQPLPRRSWRHTALGEPELAFFAERAGDANARMKALLPWWLDESDLQGSVRVPVVGMDARSIGDWARTMTARGGAAVPGVLLAAPPAREPGAVRPPQPPPPTPAERVARYRGMVSRSAYELAVFLSVPDPLTIPVMRLVQRTMLPGTGTAELAEFFVGGLLQGVDAATDTPAGDAAADVKKPGKGESCYRLVDGVRDELTRSLRYSEEGAINAQLRSVGRYLLDEGREDNSFDAVFPSPTGRHRITQWSLPFASVSKEVLTGQATPAEAPQAEATTAAPQAEREVVEASNAMLQIRYEAGEGMLIYTFHNDSPLGSWRMRLPIAQIDDIGRRALIDPEELQYYGDRLMPLELAEELDAVTGSVGLIVDARLQSVPWEMLLWTRHERSRELLALARPVLRQPPVMSSVPWQGERAVMWIVGDPSGSQAPLPGAQQEAMEVSAVLGALPPGHDVRTDIRSGSGDLRRLLRGEPFKMLFVSGHGVKHMGPSGEPRVGLQFGQGDLLTVDDILVHSSPPELVFLACNYMAEMATALLSAGVSAVVAAYDAVDDHSAFPSHFFQALTSGRTLAQAVHEARLTCFAARAGDRDIRWAQYTCFGNPDYVLFDGRSATAAVQPPAAAASTETPATTPRARLFVSWAHRDMASVEPFKKALADELRGAPDIGMTADDLWIDQQLLTDGSFGDEIIRALGEAVGVVLMVSPASLSSDHVRRELAHATSLGLPVIPVLLAPCDWHEADVGLGRPLGHIQAVPRDMVPVLAARNPGQAWREVATELVQLLPGWIRDAGRRAAPHMEMDELTFSIVQSCIRVPNRKMPTGFHTAVWVAEYVAFTCASRTQGDKFYWEEADDAAFGYSVADVWTHVIEMASERPLTTDGQLLRIAQREDRRRNEMRLLALLDDSGHALRPHAALHIAALDTRDLSAADIVYFIDGKPVRTRVLVAHGDEGRLHIEASDDTDAWPLPPEAHGAPVVVNERCVGLVAGTAMEGDYANAKDAQTLLAALQGVWLLRLHVGWEPHQRWLQSHEREGVRMDLGGADLTAVAAPKADWRRFRLTGARLVRADLRGTNFEGAELDGVDFTGAKLDGCRWEGAGLQGAVFDREQASDPSIRRAVDRSAERAATPVPNEGIEIHSIRVLTPRALRGEDSGLIEAAVHRFVAAGDTWFNADPSVSGTSTSVLHAMCFTEPSIAIACDLPSAPLLSGGRAIGASLTAVLAELRDPSWSGLLLSLGGDALFEAARTPAVTTDGATVPPDRRLLLNASEWRSDLVGPDRYISAPGLATLETYLVNLMELVIAARDASVLRGGPIFMHGYADPIPRPSPAGDGQGPWLQPAFAAYGIPIEDHMATARVLMNHLRRMLQRMADDTSRYPNLRFFDSSRVKLVPAGANQTRPDGDWATEVHLNAGGCAKLARAWSDEIAAQLRPHPAA